MPLAPALLCMGIEHIARMVIRHEAGKARLLKTPRRLHHGRRQVCAQQPSIGQQSSCRRCGQGVGDIGRWCAQIGGLWCIAQIQPQADDDPTRSAFGRVWQRRRLYQNAA